MSNDMYWASQDAKTLLGSLDERKEDYYKFLNASGLMGLWSRMYYMINMSAYGDSTLQVTGRHAEYTKFSVNHIRNLVQHVVTMTINQRPAFEPRAINSDTESQTQTILARGLLDYYLREKRLERYLKDAVTSGVTYGEGFVCPSWNATAGEIYAIDPETKIEAHEGDLQYDSFEPIDVIRSSANNSSDDGIWYILRKYVNKYDIAAKYTEVADQIKAISSSYDPRTTFHPMMNDVWDEDLIPIYSFYHKRTDAIPDGRYTLYVDGVVLTDGPLPYRDMPVYRVSAGELTGTPFGYTASYDLMSLQEMLNVLYSTIATNQAAYGVQNIAAPRGSNINVTALRDGMNFIEYDEKAGAPHALNFTATPPEVFTFLNLIERTAETLSGVNSVVRGNPETSLKSGAALALVQSMAVQFSQGLQQSYVQLLEDVGTATINILRDYASVPRIAMIAGKANRGMMKQFSGKDLSQINRVQVDVGNPMARTTAGKIELATMMLQSGIIKNADELLQVIQTGNLDPLTEGPTNELIAIKSENEALSNGEQVPVLVTDKHLLHIEEHKTVLSDPESRKNPLIVQTTLDHIKEHINLLSDPANSVLLTLMGQTPLAQPPAPGMGETISPAPQDTNGLAQSMQPNMPAPMLPGQVIPPNPNK